MGKKKRNKSKKPPERPGYKSIPPSPELAKRIQEQFQRFTEKFGRPPGPDDPLFFDPSADEPRPIIDEVVDQHMLEEMHKTGVRPALIYAYQKTGRLVTRENRKYSTNLSWSRMPGEAASLEQGMGSLRDVVECATMLPKVICAVCRRLFREDGASLQWHANAHGRAVCRHCRN